MFDFIKINYLAFLKGLVVTIVLTILLSQIGFIRINPSSNIENFLIFSVWWAIFSVLIYKIPYFKKNKGLALKIIGLLLILITALSVDFYLKIPNNPITLPLIIFFWLGVVYLVIPKFFVKYKVAILSVYGAILSYFLFFRMYSDYQENYHNGVINLLLIPIPVIIALWIYEQWRWLRTLQAEKGRAELALLKSQINPHFFFNTLNNLYGLTVEKSDKAPEVVLKLSDMMRYTIYEGKEDYVALEDEIDYLKNYIELHKLRYQKNVNIAFTHYIDESVKIAPLLFIILLENAFKHGVESLTKDAYVHLDLKANSNQIIFTIENNFEGKIKEGNNGIGLDNLKKRLKHMYPNQYELLIEERQPIYKVSLNIELT